MAHLKFDAVDRQILHALDSGFIIDDNNEVATVTDCKVEITRIEVGKLQLTVVFANVELPIVMLRTKTMETLGIKDADS